MTKRLVEQTPQVRVRQIREEGITPKQNAVSLRISAGDTESVRLLSLSLSAWSTFRTPS
jgi:hypothetical protein